jgi:hypothetical protein
MCIAQFKNITAWEKACELTPRIYHQTFNPKFNKDYGSSDRYANHAEFDQLYQQAVEI